MGLARSNKGFSEDDISPASIDAIRAARSKSGFRHATIKSKVNAKGLFPKVVSNIQVISGKYIPILFMLKNKSVFVSVNKIIKAVADKISDDDKAKEYL